MAIGLTIPFSSRIQGQVRPPDDGLESQVKAQGAQQIGKRIVGASDFVYEWLKRRDDSALDDAAAKLEVWANQTIGDLQNQSDDELSEVNPDTQEIGFKKAGRTFEETWKKEVGDLGSRLSRVGQQEFSRFAFKSHEKWRDRLATGMLKREVEANQNRVKKNIAELAVSDREALYQYAPAQIDKWFPDQERPRQMDYVLEQDYLQMIRVDPAFALASLKATGSQPFQDPGLYEALVSRAQHMITAKTVANKSQMQEFRRVAEQSLTAKVFDVERSNDPKAIEAVVGEITDATRKDLIDSEAGRVLINRLTSSEKKKESERAMRDRAYGVMRRQTDNLIDGKRSFDEWTSIYRAHLNELDVEDGEYFLEQASKGKRDMRTNAVRDARELAEKAMKPLCLLDDEKTVDDLELDSEVGGIMREIEGLAEAYFVDSKRVDTGAFRSAANLIIAQAYEKRADSEKPKKEQGMLSRWWSGTGDKVPNQAPSRPGMTRMLNAEGKEFWVPDGQVEQAVLHGWKKP